MDLKLGRIQYAVQRVSWFFFFFFRKEKVTLLGLSVKQSVHSIKEDSLVRLHLSSDSQLQIGSRRVPCQWRGVLHALTLKSPAFLFLGINCRVIVSSCIRPESDK